MVTFSNISLRDICTDANWENQVGGQLSCFLCTSFTNCFICVSEKKIYFEHKYCQILKIKINKNLQTSTILDNKNCYKRIAIIMTIIIMIIIIIIKIIKQNVANIVELAVNVSWMAQTKSNSCKKF